MRVKIWLLLFAIALVALVVPATIVRADSPKGAMAGLASRLDNVLASLDRGDLDGARSAWASFDSGWDEIEDDVRAQSRPAYRALEDAMGDVKYALRPDQTDVDAARRGVQHLQEVSAGYSAGAYDGQSTSSNPSSRGDVAGLIEHLDAALAALHSGDPVAAGQAIAEFRRDWPDAEVSVKASSARVYTSSENGAAEAAALLTANPPEPVKAAAVIQRMRDDLAPFAGGATHYGIFDAAIILLREGLEALLVVAALLAFLRKTGAADKARWIWGGSAVGILASLVVAIAVNLLFATAAAGANRELLEGITGLVAAVMLVYVSYWLHSKSRLGSWQKYIQDTSTRALARNSLISLAFIAFLAIFREGAETVLFYVGIAPSISPAELAIGLAVGMVGLLIVGALMLGFGLSLPIRPFFLVTSVLIYYLAFKFVGTGLHALQVAGLLSASPSSYLPELSFFGLFPTWETTLAQSVMLVAAVAAVIGLRVHGRPRAQRASSPARV